MSMFMLTSKQICQLFGISESTLRDWENKGHIESVKIDGLKKYDMHKVNVMFNSHTYKNYTPQHKFYPDWFYWRYENNEFGIKIKTTDDYFKEFPQLKKPFEDVNNHPWSNDKFENYNLHSIRRANSPLDHHKVRFEPKEDHSKKISGYNVSSLEFSIRFELVEVVPSDAEDRKNPSVPIFMHMAYARIDPNIITITYGGYLNEK